MPDSAEALDLLLTVATPRKVQRDGIRCHGLRYISLTLAAFVGETVTVRYDPRDLAEIRVFHRGAFLCRAVSPEIAAVSISLIGMPGFDRQLARYPQLYSRVGFAHQYRPLDAEDIPDVLEHYWQQLGLSFDPTLADEAANTVTRITGGNFRLIERLMSQVGRVLEINQLDTITPEVVEAARQTLVVGSQ